MAGEKEQNTPCLEAQQTRPSVKTTWPELVGMKAEDAEKKIKEEMSGAMVHVVPQDTFLTMEFRSNRVRLFVDSSQNVVRAPRIG
ncbi:subtilisin inhibitor [Lactuca sativa]|uniref:subtilisin inhibitor n=1 Tax=Lactuca sativa TaxID=4236 RepID=UPI000CB196C8|nr:subtilisin inhibitor [Lactuca sativa]